MAGLRYSLARPAVVQSDLTAVAPYLFWLMFRNVASDGLVFEDPVNAGVVSQPGCVLASPSWENSATQVTQDYVYHWTRDAAIVALELAAGPLPANQPRRSPARPLTGRPGRVPPGWWPRWPVCRPGH